MTKYDQVMNDRIQKLEKDYEGLVDFIRRVCVYHPDETPSWFLEEEDLSEVDPDAVHECFRNDYGSQTDCDVVRDLCEEARLIIENLEGQ